MNEMEIGQLIRPKARTLDLSITRLGDETVVYDQLTHRASCLNEISTAIWLACDGNNDLISIRKKLRIAGYQDTTEDVVLMAIEQLFQTNLLEHVEQTKVKTLGRRSVLKSLTRSVVVAIPVISTIDIQPAIAAGSNCLQKGDGCAPGNDRCCSGLRCENEHGRPRCDD